MKIRLLSVGKPKDRELGRLHDRYAERICRLGVRYETAAVPDQHLRKRESDRLLEKLDGTGRWIALERGGRSWTSEALARKVPDWASPRVTLVVGGPLGLHDEILKRAESLWSLSELTFPHELVRVLVAEQIYRALCILRGIPYHK